MGVLVAKLEAAQGAGAMVVQPLTDAAIAEAVAAGQMQQLRRALEAFHAYVAFLVCIRPPSGSLQ